MYLDNLELSHEFHPTKHSRAYLISIKHHLPIQDAKLSYMKIQIQEENEHHMGQVGVTLDLLLSNTYFIRYI